jgi:hypothetical protein
MTQKNKAEFPHVLSGWKEIALYLDKGVRTVQRYEREMGLPVRRPAGRPRAAVVATKAELDGWVNASPIREAFRLSSSIDPAIYRSSAQSIRNGLDQMAKLRQQMHDLNAELRQSTELLRQSVQGLQAELQQDHWRQDSGSFNMLEHDSREEQISTLARTLALRRKAS